MCNINVCLTIMSVQQFSVVAIYSDHAEKANDTKTRKVHTDENKLCPGK